MIDCCDKPIIVSVIGAVILESINGERYRIYCADLDQCKSCGHIHSIWGEADENLESVHRSPLRLLKSWQGYEGQNDLVVIHLDITRKVRENDKGADK